MLITAAADETVTVQSVTHIDKAAVDEATYFVNKMRIIGVRAEYVESESKKRMCDRDKTPVSASKCNTLAEHPTGESL